MEKALSYNHNTRFIVFIFIYGPLSKTLLDNGCPHAPWVDGEKVSGVASN